MSGKTNKSIKVNFIWRALERFGAQGISFVVSLVLARLLDPEVYGTIALVTVFITILQVFVDGGLGNALIQKKEVDDTDFSSVFFFNIAFGVLLYLVLFFTAPYIAGFYKLPELTPIIRVLGLSLIVSGLRNVQQAYISRNMLFKRFFWSTIGGTIISAVAGMVMAYKGYGVWALVVLNLTNVCIGTLILWISLDWKPKWAFSWNRLKVLISFGWKLLAGRLIETLYSEAHALIIGKKYTQADLAHYNRGKQYPNMVVTNIDYSITSVLFPVMSSYQDDREKCKSIVQRAITTNIYIIAPLMMGLAVCAEPIVRLVLTEKWLPCVPYLRIFCFTMTFLSFNTANMNTYRSLGRSDIYLIVEIVRKTIGVAVLLATMWFGVFWMACGEILVTLFSMIITAIPNKKLIGYGFLSQLRDVLPSLILTLVMGLGVYSIQLLPLWDGLTLILQILAGAIIYVAGSWLFRLDSFTYLLSMIRGKRKDL